MLSIGDLQKGQAPYRRIWVKKALCCVCKRPIIITLNPGCLSVERECWCDHSCRPVEIITSNPDDFYEIKLEGA
jgi:hypothetical protein